MFLTDACSFLVQLDMERDELDRPIRHPHTFPRKHANSSAVLSLPTQQLDMEMSWMDRDAIMGLMEQMVAQLFQQVRGYN